MLTPGRFVGAEDEVDDGVPFDEKFAALKETLEEQFITGLEVQNLITDNLKRLEQ